MENLTNQETATVLAALRYWQENVIRHQDQPTDCPEEYRGHFEDWLPLNMEKIDELCEKLNAPDSDEYPTEWVPFVTLGEGANPMRFKHEDDRIYVTGVPEIYVKRISQDSQRTDCIIRLSYEKADVGPGVGGKTDLPLTEEDWERQLEHENS